MIVIAAYCSLYFLHSSLPPPFVIYDKTGVFPAFLLLSCYLKTQSLNFYCVLRNSSTPQDTEVKRSGWKANLDCQERLQELKPIPFHNRAFLRNSNLVTSIFQSQLVLNDHKSLQYGSIRQKLEIMPGNLRVRHVNKILSYIKLDP